MIRSIRHLPAAARTFSHHSTAIAINSSNRTQQIYSLHLKMSASSQSASGSGSVGGLQASAVSYLSQHNIKQALEQLVNEVVQQRPQQPYAHMAQRMQQWAQTPPTAASFANGTATATNSTSVSNSMSKNNAPVKPQVVFVLGGPGAGKGTQCANLVRDFGFVHLSAGDLLREARQKQDDVGRMIDACIKEGSIVPVEVTVQLLKRAMEQQMSVDPLKSKFLVDGFPRNHENLQGWHSVMGDSAEVLFVLFFDCTQDVMEQRLLVRGETSGRTDDNIESIRKRFVTYQQSTVPIIEHYHAKGQCHKIDSTKDKQTVYEQVQKVFKSVK